MKPYLKGVKSDITREFKKAEIIPNKAMIDYALAQIESDTHIKQTEKYMYVDVIFAVRATIKHALDHTFGG